ncbi:MAG: glycerol-3-phosphate 1-O-acyltransferase PlsY [Planctomycetota bacterium]
MSATPYVLVAAAGYLVGSAPFAYLAGKWISGVDIRRHGSGNVGATNLGRVVGAKVGVAVFALDVAKGFLAVLAAPFLSGVAGGAGAERAIGILAGLAAILGHVFPVWLGFRGGKGVATGAGVVVALAPLPAAAALLVFAVAFAAFRMVSVGSMAAAAALPALYAGIARLRGSWDGDLFAFILVITALVIAAHRSNIRRLLAGTEPRAGEGRKQQIKS